MTDHFESAMAEDVVLAAIDLAARAGAKSIEIGYLHDDVPVAEAAWYATAQYRGAKITCEGQTHPVMAAEGLARRLLTGAKCMHCGALVALDSAGAYAGDATLMDGTPWLVEQQVAAGVCRWWRDGRVWRRGCEKTTGEFAATAPGGNRAERRGGRHRGRRAGGVR